MARAETFTSADYSAAAAAVAHARARCGPMMVALLGSRRVADTVVKALADASQPDTTEHTRIAILEDRIRYALTMIEAGCVGEAALELDRALNDPDMFPPYPNPDSRPVDDDRPF